MTLRFVILFLLALTAIHAVWEFAQCAPLYVEGRFPMSLANMLRVTVADAGLSALIYSAVALAQRDVAWGLQPKRWALLAAEAIGAALAVGIEWHALSNNRWAYSPWMPTIFGLGLLPLLQLGAGTVLPLWMGQWGSRSRPAVSETPSRRVDVKGSSEIMSDKLLVPAAITAAVKSFGHRAGPCAEHEISSAIQAVRAPSGQVSEAENTGAWAELLAFSLTGGARENPWNTYFGPHSTRKMPQGSGITRRTWRVSERNSSRIGHNAPTPSGTRSSRPATRTCAGISDVGSPGRNRRSALRTWRSTPILTAPNRDAIRP